MKCGFVLPFLLATGTASSGEPSSFAALLSRPEAARLTVESLTHFFEPFLSVEKFSRGACFPVLKATSGSALPVAASFIGTTVHDPCDPPQKITIMTFQFRSADPDKDAAVLRDALLALNGPSCFAGSQAGHDATFWSNEDRILSVSAAIDQGAGYTVSLFSRAAVSPPADDTDRQTYALWDNAAPPGCRKPRP